MGDLWKHPKSAGSDRGRVGQAGAQGRALGCFIGPCGGLGPAAPQPLAVPSGRGGWPGLAAGAMVTRDGLPRQETGLLLACGGRYEGRSWYVKV